MTDKSINASERLGKGIMNPYDAYLCARFNRFLYPSHMHLPFKPNNAAASGVNPTHSLETGIK